MPESNPIKELRELAALIQHSDPAGVAKIAFEANWIILEYNLTHSEVMAALIGVPGGVQLLTGHKMSFSEDDVVMMLQASPEMLRRAMDKFPGKRGFIDLQKLVVAINNGKFAVSA